MRVSAKSDYALRALIEMARSTDGRPVSAEELGRRQEIPHGFLQAILADLRKAGVVVSQRGQSGGWRLAREASEVSVADVIRAVDASADAEMAGVTPRELADHLGITTAAVTVLVARLVSSGHLERRPHPTDRRSVFLVPTDKSRTEMTKHLSEMHERMRDIASSVPEHARTAVVDFLEALTHEMEGGRLDLGRS